MRLLKDGWYCCREDECCSIGLRQLWIHDVYHKQHTHTFGVCLPLDVVLCVMTVLDTFPHQCVVSHPVSPPLPVVVGQVRGAFSTRVWLVLVCQLYFGWCCSAWGTLWIDQMVLMLWPLLLNKLTIIMIFWCCFFCRDCGGSGKRKSGKKIF